MKEYRDGTVTHTKPPRERKAVEEYLSLQGRFAHLFTPQRQDEVIASIQARVDAYWASQEL